jgi:hypothetical protein
LRKGLRDVPHVRPDGAHRHSVRRIIAIEHDPSAVGKVQEYVLRRVLIDSHHTLTAPLNVCESAIARRAVP